MAEGVIHSNYVKEKITVITLIFMMWGFITVTNDYLVSELKMTMVMSKLQERVLSYIFFFVFLIVSIPASYLVKKIGFKKSILTGLVTAASCSLFMVPGARELSYSWVLIGVIILATGVTILQVSANPYVMLIGDNSKGASSLVSNQAFNSIGTWLAPLISMLVLDSTVDPTELNLMQKSEMAETVVLPYILFSVILVGLTIRLHFSKLPLVNKMEDLYSDLKEDKGSAWAYPHVLLGAVAIFCYVFAEVAIGSNLGRFIKSNPVLSQFSGMSEFIVAYFWGSAMVGRFIGGRILEKIEASTLIVLCSSGAIILLFLTMANPGVASMMMLLFIGLFNSILFPAIFAVTCERMGKYTAQASGILNTAIIGGAVGMFFVNEFFDSLGGTSGVHLMWTAGLEIEVNSEGDLWMGMPALKWAFLIAIPLYLYIIYFGASGFKRKVKES